MEKRMIKLTLERYSVDEESGEETGRAPNIEVTKMFTTEELTSMRLSLYGIFSVILDNLMKEVKNLLNEEIIKRFGDKK